MLPVLDTDQYFNKIKNTPKAGENNILAFYNSHIKAICENPRLCLVPLDDHMVHRGDGVFEALAHNNGSFFLLSEHLERLKISAEKIGISLPCSLDELRKIIAQVALAGKVKKSVIRIFVGRGVGSFGVNPKDCKESSLYVICTVFTGYGEHVYIDGVKALTSSYRAKEEYLATVKSLNYLPNVLMKKEALDKGYDLPLVFDEHDILTEGTTENIIIVDQNDNILIPSFKRALKGTTVNLLADLLIKNGHSVLKDQAIKKAEIFQAKEVIAIGTTTQAVPIINVDGKEIANGKVGDMAKLARKLILESIENSSEFVE